MRHTVLIAALIAASSTASADPCFTAQSSFDAVSQLEEVAATFPKAPKKLGFPEYAQCLPKLRDRKLAKRALAACDLILQMDGNQRMCIDLAGMQGERKVGSVDVVAAIAARPIDPLALFNGPGGAADPTMVLLARFRHQPAAAKIVDAWKATAARKLKGNQAYAWTEWRKLAVRVMVSLGGKDEKAFVEQLITKETDTELKELMDQAIDYLDP